MRLRLVCLVSCLHGPPCSSGLPAAYRPEQRCAAGSLGCRSCHLAAPAVARSFRSPLPPYALPPCRLTHHCCCPAFPSPWPSCLPAEAIQLALDGGVTVVQLREKDIEGGAFMEQVGQGTVTRQKRKRKRREKAARRDLEEFDLQISMG